MTSEEVDFNKDYIYPKNELGESKMKTPNGVT